MILCVCSFTSLTIADKKLCSVYFQVRPVAEDEMCKVIRSGKRKSKYKKYFPINNLLVSASLSACIALRLLVCDVQLFKFVEGWI